MGVFILFCYRFVIGYFQKFHSCLLGFDFVITIKTPSQPLPRLGKGGNSKASPAMEGVVSVILSLFCHTELVSASIVSGSFVLCHPELVSGSVVSGSIVFHGS